MSDEIPEHIKQQVFECRVVGPTKELAAGFNPKNRAELHKFMQQQCQERLAEFVERIREYYGFHEDETDSHIALPVRRVSEGGIILP